MQVNEFSAKELYSSLQKVSNLGTYQTVETVATFEQELSTKPYYVRYKQLFWLCVVLSFLAQIASLISSYAYFAGVFAVAIKHPYLLVAGVVVVLMTIEILKRFLLTNSLQSWFGLQRTFAPLPTFFAVLLSVLSMYASVIGGGSFGVDTQKEVVTAAIYHDNTDSLAKVYDTEIAIIRTEIAKIEHRNSLNGATWLPKTERKLVHAKEQRIRELQAAKDLDIANHKQQAAKELDLVRTENQTNKAMYQYWFLGFELLFLACMVFMYDYKRKSVLENLLQVPQSPTIATVPTHDIANNTTTANVGVPNTNPNTITPNTPIPNPPTPRIGFIYGTTAKPAVDDIANVDTAKVDTANVVLQKGERICLHCGTVYTYNIHNQKFCTENCRVESWEQRTGKKVKKGGKK